MASAPVTSINQIDGAVIVYWEEPDERGSQVIKYLVQFYDKTNPDTWYVDTDNCDGLQEEILTSRICIIPMSTFTTTLGYQLSDSIGVRVSAINEKGISLPSDMSDSSATAKVVPQPVPSSYISRGSLTTENLLHVVWQPLTTNLEIGGSEILSYNVQYD